MKTTTTIVTVMAVLVTMIAGLPVKGKAADAKARLVNALLLYQDASRAAIEELLDTEPPTDDSATMDKNNIEQCPIDVGLKFNTCYELVVTYFQSGKPSQEACGCIDVCNDISKMDYEGKSPLDFDDCLDLSDDCRRDKIHHIMIDKPSRR